MRGFFYGIVFTVVLVVAGGVTALVLGLIPAGADSKAGFVEKTVARTSLYASISRDLGSLHNPLQPSDANLLAAVKLYGENCAVCHAASNGKASLLAQGFYIDAPLFAKHGVEGDDEAVTFWKLKHGIRFTAMPAFGSTLGDDDLWKLSMFLKRLDDLPPAVDTAWRALPSVAGSPDAAPGAATATTPDQTPAPAPDQTPTPVPAGTDAPAPSP
ncbi:MAG: c-type cytochrome [Candidatus Baltobacteraceae bacterium]